MTVKSVLVCIIDDTEETVEYAGVASLDLKPTDNIYCQKTGGIIKLEVRSVKSSMDIDGNITKTYRATNSGVS